MTSAELIHRTIAPLWPLLDANTFAIDIGSAAWVEDAAGVFVDVENEALFERYVESTASSHPARRLLQERPMGLRSILVVDYQSAADGGGFQQAVKVAVHELAHAAREELSSGGFYPRATRVVEVDRYLQERLAATKDRHERERMPKPRYLLLEDLRSVQDFMFQFEDQQGAKPIFGDWAIATDQCDVGHDLLFYLLLYLLEREAADSGAFEHQWPLERSTFFPPWTEPAETTTTK